jgi:ketosteroid isomerase-like protein
MVRRFSLLVIGCVLVSVPCSAQDKATIEKQQEKFTRALSVGDMTALGGIYAEDAYLLPPGADMVRGRSAIQEFWTQARGDIGALRLTTLDVKPLGTETAREIGTFVIRGSGPQSQDVSGKYVSIWQKFAEDWKLATYIWNLNE